MACGEIEAAQFFRLCNAARVSHARREKLITLPRETREREFSFVSGREGKREREAVCVSSSRARVLRSRFSRRRDATFVEEDTAVVVVASGTPVDEGERRGRFSR